VCVLAGKNLCNKYPPLIGFEVDRVSSYSFNICQTKYTVQKLNAFSFALEQYLGRWWQMEKTPSVSELPGKCWSSFYYRDATNPEKLKLRMDYVTRM